MRKSDEKTIDFRDFFAELLRRWKTVLIITLVFTVLAAGFAKTKISARRKQAAAEAGKKKAAKEINLEEEIKKLREEKRGMITDAEAADVERIYAQYSSYIDFRNMYQDELQNYNKAYDKSGEDMLIKRVNYRLISCLEGAETHFTAYSLDLEDYKKIVKILPDVNTLSAAYKHVYFGAIASPATEVKNLGEPAMDYPTEYLITVEMFGNTRDICDEVWEVVKEGFNRKLKELKKLDPDIKMELVNSNYRGNVYDYVIGREQPVFDSVQKIDSIINTLKTQAIDKFTEEQMAYYQALANPQRGLIDKGVISISGLNGDDAGMETAPQYLRGRTMVLLGMLAGLLLSVLFVLIRYLSTGTIKINREMQDYYQIPVLSTFFVPGKKRSLFSGLIRWLVHADSIGPEIKADMVAADTCGAVRNEGGQTVYIVQLGNDTDDGQVASTIKSSVESCDPAVSAFTGTPLTNVGEMRKLAQEKNVLLLIHNKKTLKADVEKLLDFCSRHSIRVLGAVNIVNV